MPTPYLVLSTEDAGALHVGEGRAVRLMVGETIFQLPVVLQASLPPGVAGLPVLPASAGVPLPAWGRIRMNGDA
jgi:NADH-quinone oxidoreductase subunit G